MSEQTNLSMLAPLNRVLSEHIADQVRQAIMTDQLKPGQRIVEGEIAQAMATSRGPVRDALLLLEKEGLVVRYPHRGTFVARLSIQDAEEIYSLRQAIESLAVAYVVKRATDDEIDELERHVDRMEKKVKEGYDQQEATRLDLDFHRALCRMSRHRRLLDAWEALSGQTHVLILTHRTRNPRDFEELAVEWHRRLVNALRHRDLERAQEELRRHLAITVEGMISSSLEGSVSR